MSLEPRALVSVVIPCYKQAHYLGEAIESVLAQSYEPVEIIVVDDGSPDDTSAVAARYPGVRCLRQENRGLAGARNAGFAASRGEYLVFLDSDDRLLPDAIRAGMDAMRTRPESGFVCGHTRYIDADGAPATYNQRPCVGVSYATLLAHNMIECPAMVLYRRAVLEELGTFSMSPALKAVEDHDLYLRIARTYPVHCHHHPATEYRKHGASMSQNYERMLKSVLFVLGSQRPFVAGNPELERARRTGMEFYRRVFGEGMIGQLRDRVRRRADKGEWLHSLGVLLRYYPQGVAENVLRKLRVLTRPSSSSRSDVA